MNEKDNKIEKLLDLNMQLSEEIQTSLPAIVESLGKTKFKYTGKVLLTFVPRSGYLNSAILELSASKNIYPVAVLYRSIIEHNFRHLYIYTKSLKDNSDEVGEKYCKTLKYSEDLQWFDKVNKHNKKVGVNKTIWSTKGNHNKSIRDTKREILFSNILNYFKSNNINESKEITQFINDHILERSVEYDNLSSAVHGGPSAESALFNLNKDNKKYKDTLYKFAHDSLGLHYSIVESTYLFAYLMDEEMKEHYGKIEKLKEKLGELTT